MPPQHQQRGQVPRQPVHFRVPHRRGPGLHPRFLDEPPDGQPVARPGGNPRRQLPGHRRLHGALQHEYAHGCRDPGPGRRRVQRALRLLRAQRLAPRRHHLLARLLHPLPRRRVHLQQAGPLERGRDYGPAAEPERLLRRDLLRRQRAPALGHRHPLRQQQHLRPVRREWLLRWRGVVLVPCWSRLPARLHQRLRMRVCRGVLLRVGRVRPVSRGPFLLRRFGFRELLLGPVPGRLLLPRGGDFAGAVFDDRR